LKSFPILSYHKYKYAITFVDDFTSHAWMVCLRTKVAIHAIRHFLAMVCTQYKTSVERWMSDGGGECISENVLEMFKNEGIVIHRSPPHTPQVNGHAERFMRTMMDKADTMRHQACAPDSWWEFAIEYAVHIYNRTPLERLKWITPHGAVTGEVPLVKHLRVFGCSAYVLIPADVRKNKLAPKSEMMTFIGWGNSGYMFMRAPNNVIFRNARALFDEGFFLKCPEDKQPNARLRNAPESEENDDVTPTPHGFDDDEFDIPSRPTSPLQKGKGKATDESPARDPRTPNPPHSDPEGPSRPTRERRITATPPPSDDEREEPPSPTPPPQRPQRMRRMPTRLRDDAHGDVPPALRDAMKRKDWKQLFGDNEPGSSRARAPEQRQQQVPVPSVPDPTPEAPAPRSPTSGRVRWFTPDETPKSDTPIRPQSPDTSASDPNKSPDELQSLLAKLCREGGVDLIHTLLKSAIDEEDPIKPV
jgi:hypothetical protein